MVNDEISTADALEEAKLISKTRLLEMAIIGISVAGCIASLSIPLYVVYLMITALAGKTTAITAAISYTSAGAVGAASGTAVVTGGIGKYRSQRKELIRLRARCTESEDRLKRKGRRP